MKVWCVGPGMLATNLGRLPKEVVAGMVAKMGLGHPSIGGELIRKVAEGERDADVGKIVLKDGISTW